MVENQSQDSVPPVLKLLTHDVRWQLIQALKHTDLKVQELVDLVGKKQNLVSYHLKLLKSGDLVRERKSSQDARDIYYSLNLGQALDRLTEVGQLLFPHFGNRAQQTEAEKPHRLLFLCTHNSARSQMSEGFARKLGGELLEVHSAGSKVTQVHPKAIEMAATFGVDLSQQRSKHVETLVGQHFDYVITVCDKAKEICPVFPDGPTRLHWSIANPAAVTGDEATINQAFLDTAQQLETRIKYFLQTLN